jgi:transposase
MRKKALFEIKDWIVSVLCPYCGSAQPSPNYPQSRGWDMKDVRSVGSAAEVNCSRCRRSFPLPAQLFSMIVEETAVRQHMVERVVPRTCRQREILKYIEGFMERNGYQPSYTQIAMRFSLRSKATIAKHVAALERRGLLARRHVGGHFYITLTNGNAEARTVLRERLMAVLDQNFEQAGVRITTRRYNKILTDLGFTLEA